MDASTLARHLERHYGIDGEIRPIPRGRAANYAVCGDGQRWLLKVFQAEHRLNEIEQAGTFVSFLSRAGYPAREFVRSATGRTTIMLGDRVAVLVPWIDGVTPEPNQVSSADALFQIGALCGRLHRLAAACPQRDGLTYAGSARSVAQKMAALLRLAKEQRQTETEDQVNVRLRILSCLGEALDQSHRRARRGIIHGDFSGAHVVFDGDRATGVVDVTGELYLPGWEMMRAFFQSVPFDHDAGEALAERWRSYVGGYAREQQVTRQEIAINYDVYLLQLAGSTYGLRLPGDDGLRAFGRWRTRLARYLAEHRAELRPSMAASVLD